MKQIVVTTIILAAAGFAHADTTDEFSIQSGNLTATLTDGEVTFADPGTCTGNGCSVFQWNTIPPKHFYDRDAADGTIGLSSATSNLFNDWLITVVGQSDSPGLAPYGLELSIEATCDGPACVGANGELNISYSDENFTTAASSLEVAYSGLVTGNGSTTAAGYSSNADKLFAETTLIGKAGPFSSLFGATASGGASPNSPYSLTLTDEFEAGQIGSSFHTDLDITGFTPPTTVPEPGAVFLFGTVLVLLTSKLRTRLAR